MTHEQCCWRWKWKRRRRVLVRRQFLLVVVMVWWWMSVCSSVDGQSFDFTFADSKPSAPDPFIPYWGDPTTASGAEEFIDSGNPSIMQSVAKPLSISDSLALRTGDRITLQSVSDFRFARRVCCLPNTTLEIIVTGPPPPPPPVNTSTATAGRPTVGYAVPTNDTTAHLTVVVGRSGSGLVHLMADTISTAGVTTRNYVRVHCCIEPRTHVLVIDGLIPYSDAFLFVIAPVQYNRSASINTQTTRLNTTLPSVVLWSAATNSTLETICCFDSPPTAHNQTVRYRYFAAVANDSDTARSPPPQTAKPNAPTASVPLSSETARPTVTANSSTTDPVSGVDTGSDLVITDDDEQTNSTTAPPATGNGAPLRSDSNANANGQPPTPAQPVMLEPIELSEADVRQPIRRFEPSQTSPFSIFILRRAGLSLPESYENFDFGLPQSVTRLQPMILGEHELINLSALGQSLRFTIEHVVEASAEFTFQNSFTVSAGTTFGDFILPGGFGPSGLVVALTESQTVTIRREDITTTHFIAEFTARAEPFVNVTARGLLDITSTHVPFTVRVVRLLTSAFGDVVPYVYSLNGTFSGTYAWNMRYLVV